MVLYMKSSFLFLTVLILSLGFDGCGSAYTSNEKIIFMENPPFVIAESYYQDWVAGTKEGGSGANVNIIFTSIQPEVTIENIYFRNQILKLQPSKDTPSKYIGYLRNKSGNDFIMDSDPIKEAQNTPNDAFPINLEKNEAVISYNFQGKKEYFKLTNLSEKKRIAYPQSNPNIRN